MYLHANVYSNAWKVIRSHSKSIQNILDVMHKDWFGSNTYSSPIHPFQSHIEYSLNLRGRWMSWRWECGWYILIWKWGKTKDGIIQMDLMSKIPCQVSKSLRFLTEGRSLC